MRPFLWWSVAFPFSITMPKLCTFCPLLCFCLILEWQVNGGTLLAVCCCEYFLVFCMMCCIEFRFKKSLNSLHGYFNYWNQTLKSFNHELPNVLEFEHETGDIPSGSCVIFWSSVWLLLSLSLLSLILWVLWGNCTLSPLWELCPWISLSSKIPFRSMLIDVPCVSFLPFF